MDPPYYLSSHVFLSVVDDSYILLDLEMDKYFSVDPQRAKALEQFIAGWPPGEGTANAVQATSPETRAGADISALLKQGLLTKDPTNGKQASPVLVETPANALIRRDLSCSPSVTLRDLLAFLHSSACVAMLRRRSIASIVKRVKRRKTHKSASPESFDMTEVQRLLAVFDALRPLFPGRYLCMADSLLFLEFLAHHRIYPTWIFGVRMRPWGAHCWLQQSGVVLNDSVERVRNFTPIMAI